MYNEIFTVFVYVKPFKLEFELADLNHFQLNNEDQNRIGTIDQI